MSNEQVKPIPHDRQTFGIKRREMTTIRRRDLNVHVASTAKSGERVPPTPDPAAIAEAQRRFAVCKTCEHSRDDAFACTLYPGCCFGRFRSDIKNACPAGLW